MRDSRAPSVQRPYAVLCIEAELRERMVGRIADYSIGGA